MPVQLFQNIRQVAGHLAYKSVVYNWSLRGSVPDRFVVRPVDMWPGRAEYGRWLIGGAFVIEGDQLTLRGECWEPVGVDQAWLDHMHGFTWLRDLRALGGDKARRQARGMIGSWIRHYRSWQSMSWRPDITGERIAMWVALYEFFGASANDQFQDMFFESLIRQARHLSRALPENLYGAALLRGIKGLIYAGLAFEGHENWISQALDLLDKEIDSQILGDGAHISRNPAQILEVLQILLDIRTALAAGDYPLPEKIQHAIDKVGPALRFFRYADKHFSMLNGTQEGDQDLVDSVLGQAGVRGKALQSLPCAGYERATLGRTLVMFDCGRTPDFPHDRQTHAAPLAFEMAYGKDRLFVSCGTHPTSLEWQDSLRATAAHNTAGIDYRNACEIRSDGHFSRKVKTVAPLREDSREACLLEGSHDGYVELYGIIHRRRLFLSNQGHDFRGEDIFTSNVDLSRPLEVAIRFHIHPRVMVSLVQDGTEALLRLKGGIGWRFCHSGSTLAGSGLALEDSVYLGHGSRPRKTKQLVIYGQFTEKINEFKWRLQREG